MGKKKPTQLAKAKLESSGLTPQDAKSLGILTLSPTQTKALFPKYPLPSIKFVYHDIDGNPRKDTYRVRLLAEPPPGSFGEQPKKPLRYLQPPKTPPAAYLPKTVDWAAVAKDPSTTIVITEGELKSACAAKYGFKCLGLGGVSSWRSGKRGWDLLPELAQVVWRGRDVVVCFDSDIKENAGVSQAAAALVSELTRRGALPRVAFLPQVGDDKTGLDDFIVASGPETLTAVFDDAEGDELSRKLWEFNSRFTFILNPGIIYDDQHHHKHRPNDFKNAIYSNVWAAKQVGEQLKKVRVASEWVDWECRRQVQEMTYRPAEDRFIDDVLNTWEGWGCEPECGSVQPWKDLLAHLFKGSPIEELAWFESWCLYPLYKPGTKLLTAAGIWSTHQGQGKSLIGETLGKIYGVNYNSISQRELESAFNGWAVHKQFVMVDDVSSHDSRAKADILKTQITTQTMQVNIKFLPGYELPNCVNYYLTSNRPNAFYIDDQDRRFFVHEVTEEKQGPKFYDTYFAWMRGKGPSALLYYAQNEHDFGAFEPFAPPPFTRAKSEMIDSVKGELSYWLSELKKDPESKLRLGQYKLERDLFTAAELLNLFDQDRKGRPVALNTMGLFLRNYFPVVYGGNPFRVGGASGRYYAVRNEKQWTGADRKKLTAHIEKVLAKEQGAKRY